jgi:ElaB/YqjD/DUF883 family membrane-anchored ribosome-binding protein
MRWAWIAAALATAAWAGESKKTSADDVTHDAEKTAQAAAKLANEKKEDFEKRVGSKLDDARKRMEELRRQGERDKARFVAEADAKGKEAEKRMDELKRSTGEAWKDLRKGVETAVDDFAHGVDKAKR